MATHRVPATPETVRWGTFDAATPPVVTVNSGDTVVLECVSGSPDTLPPPGSGLTVPPALPAIHAKIPRGPGHIITGPVAVAGAEPGDMLEVKIEAIEYGADWGFCGFRPLAGTLPNDFSERFLTIIPIDRAAGTCRLPYGVELKLAPFFGVMGVAPRASFGTISTVQPREHGGNLDNKELGVGATLYLPVWARGALFSAGDGHGVQGDGEVCINAIETGLIGRFRLTVRDDMRLEWPYAETPTHVITMAFDPDLDDCVVIALRLMLDLMEKRIGLSRSHAYMLASLAADLRITQVVNGNKGVHCMLEKKYLRR